MTVTEFAVEVIVPSAPILDDEDTEPPVPSGLKALSGALATIVGFLNIDEDLIAVAAEASPPLANESGADLAGNRGTHRDEETRDYDLTVSLLRDLSAVARRDGHDDSFTTRLLELRTRHERKPSLQERLEKAGLPRS